MGGRRVRLGVEKFFADPPGWLRRRRVGLLCNQASVDSSFVHVRDRLTSKGGNLVCLFCPQHGFHADKQANMIESSDDWDAAGNIPVFSLYGKVRAPTEEMLKRVDVLLVDLPDVGTRVYTYATTLGMCLEAAGRQGVEVVVLDRPNPLGGAEAEGNVLADDHRSFVGYFPVPMRHGLTIGEMARFHLHRGGCSCTLRVATMSGWERHELFPETLLPWVYPSPNMPTWETALLYPGLVLLEGTNISEGRGTTLPFQLFGAPFVDQKAMLDHLMRNCLDGLVFRPVSFEPMFDKWRGRLCHGFQIHLTEPRGFRPYRLGLAILKALLAVHGDRFEWLPPPYEYEYLKLPIDILLGSTDLRKGLESNLPIEDLESAWQPGLAAYQGERQSILLY
jgi:uncharacterized protein YbbC (DUF1343 family)